MRSVVCSLVMQPPAMYESWDLSPPVVPSRSRLYSLEPIGIGTADVESFTGYIARLAEAHAVTVGNMLVDANLFRDMVKSPLSVPQGGNPRRSPVSTCWSKFRTLNGMRGIASTWIDAFERATLRQDLSALTLLPFKEVLSEKCLLRRVRAWCSICYEERRITQSPLYDALLWTFKAVTACPRHQQPLEETCPHCSRWQPLLAAFTRPGYCSRCCMWLGSMGAKKGSNPISPRTSAADALWVGKAVGELLAAMQDQPPRSLKEHFRQNLWTCIDHLARGNQLAFGHFIQTSGTLVRNWVSGRCVPRLDSLLSMCYHLQISPRILLTGAIADGSKDWESRKSSAILRHQRVVAPLRRSATVREALKEALYEDPPPRLIDVVHRLGYRGVDRLYRVGSDLCKQITARHLQAKRSRGQKKPATERISDKHTMKKALERSLAMAWPLSVYHLAATLGYTNGWTLYHAFPDLCQAINTKRAEQRRVHLNGIRRVLETALKEDPPPTLTEVSRRVGYLDFQPLQRSFPTLCVALQDRRKEYRSRRSAELRTAFEALLSEDPPLSVRKAFQRVGVHDKVLRDKFPDLVIAIASRYLKHRAETSERRKDLLRKEIRRIVVQLYHQGIFPSSTRVTRLLPTTSLKGWELRGRYLKEVRQELGLEK